MDWRSLKASKTILYCFPEILSNLKKNALGCKCDITATSNQETYVLRTATVRNRFNACLMVQMSWRTYCPNL